MWYVIKRWKPHIRIQQLFYITVRFGLSPEKPLCSISTVCHLCGQSLRRPWGWTKVSSLNYFSPEDTALEKGQTRMIASSGMPYNYTRAGWSQIEHINLSRQGYGSFSFRWHAHPGKGVFRGWSKSKSQISFHLPCGMTVCTCCFTSRAPCLLFAYLRFGSGASCTVWRSTCTWISSLRKLYMTVCPIVNYFQARATTHKEQFATKNLSLLPDST